MNLLATQWQLKALRALLTVKITPPVPPGGPEVVAAVAFNFTSGTISIGAFPVGAILDHAQVMIETPFDGISPSIRFGTSADPTLFLGPSDTAPEVVGQYLSEALVPATSSDVMLLSIQAPGATAGAGLLFYRLLLP